MHDKWSGPELDSLLGKGALTRREILVTSLAVGFAAAALPVRADTVIATSTAGLVAGEIKIPVADGEIPGYRAMPSSGGPFPVVLVVQEIFGVHEHIRDVCRRFAREGYLAVAPELYARQGDVSKFTDYREIFAQVVSKVPDAQVMAAVAWYGRLAGQATELQPKYPLDVAGELKVPVLGLYGGQDQGIPLEDVEKMRAALATAKQPSEIVVFPDAPHGFNADYRPSYRAREAKDAWDRCLAWFRRNGAA
jgi:carboxymethylenebutenolidase